MFVILDRTESTRLRSGPQSHLPHRILGPFLRGFVQYAPPMGQIVKMTIKALK
jgi:hypothetical protein